jgi:hypothetical protein
MFKSKRNTKINSVISLEKMGDDLFSINIGPKISLENIYLNGRSNLIPFQITNDSSNALYVSLRSTLDNQIFFQNSNENLQKSLDIDEKKQLEGSREFNELFNSVNYINHLVMKPKEAAKLILLFQPKGSGPIKAVDTFDYFDILLKKRDLILWNATILYPMTSLFQRFITQSSP